jgi:hypothetical protein
MGRRMCATAANLIERTLPEVDLRQWVLTFPFSWRRRLAQDGELLVRLTRIFVETVHAFYALRAESRGVRGAKTGAVTVVQRTSSDLRLNPHLHVVFLDGAYHEQHGELAWQALGHLKSSEVGEVLERAVRRMEKHLRRRGMAAASDDGDPEDHLAASAVLRDALAGFGPAAAGEIRLPTEIFARPRLSLAAPGVPSRAPADARRRRDRRPRRLRCRAKGACFTYAPP